MNRIKTIIFDIGGVIIELDQSEAVRRFQEIGLLDAARRLDPYTQSGIFGDLECGKITAEEFCRELGRLIGHEVTYGECEYAWQGYLKAVPPRNLEMMQQLRSNGYRVVALSNTNEFAMNWALSASFDGCGHSLRHYVDAVYLSYELKLMKPDERFFRKVLEMEATDAAEALFIDDSRRNVEAAGRVGLHTCWAKNGEDWRSSLLKVLGRQVTGDNAGS